MAILNAINDFHIHTQHSDGEWTVEELFKSVKTLNLDSFAITDHNIFEGVAKARRLQLPEQYGLNFINGIEIFCWHNCYLFDVLLYGFDLFKMSKLGLFSLREKQDRNRAIMLDLFEKADKLGLVFDKNRLINDTDIGGRSTFYEELERHIENKQFLKTLPKSFMIRDISPHNPLAIDYKKHYTPLAELREIADNVGGILSLAHPLNRYTWRNQLQFVYDILETGAMDAIEAYHTAISPTESKLLLNIAQEKNLIVTGGSDCHKLNQPLGFYNHKQTPIPKLDFWKDL